MEVHFSSWPVTQRDSRSDRIGSERSQRTGVVVRLFKGVFLILVAIVGSAVVWGLGGMGVQRWELRHMMHSLTVKFPVGIELSRAQAAVDRDYPQHTSYSAADCEKWSHQTTPWTLHFWTGEPRQPSVSHGRRSGVQINLWARQSPCATRF